MLFHIASRRELLMAWASIMSFVFINKVCCIFQFPFQSCAPFCQKRSLSGCSQSIILLCISGYLFFLIPFVLGLFPVSLSTLLPLQPAKTRDIFSKDSPYSINFKAMRFSTIFPRFMFLKTLRKDNQGYEKSHLILLVGWLQKPIVYFKTCSLAFELQHSEAIEVCSPLCCGTPNILNWVASY